MQPQSTVLALSGGGARGAAHLGAIEVLVQNGFTFERVVGVSIGSLVAAMYAFEPDVERVQARALDYLLSDDFQNQCQRHLFGARPAPEECPPSNMASWYGRAARYLRANRLFHRVVTRPSILPAKVLDDVIAALVPDADIADAAVPLTIVAVDLRSGRRAELDRGPVRTAIRASKSLPAIFPPVEWDGMLLCDIGVFDSLPTVTARSYTSGCVIGVDVAAVIAERPTCANALEVLLRMDEISESMYRHHSRRAADLIVTPSVAETEWFDFSRPVELVEAGRTAAREALGLAQVGAAPAVHS